MDKNALQILGIVLLAAGVGAGKYAPSQLPKPDHYVVDYADVIQPNREQELNGILQNLEHATGAQYIILTIDSTGGVPIADYCLKVANDNWRLGQQGKDNGMLFAIAVADREYRFTPGRGLEGFLTDDYLGRLGNDVLVPYLKQGQYSEGIYAVNRQVAQRIAEQLRVAPTRMPARPQAPPRSRMPAQPHVPVQHPMSTTRHSVGPDLGAPCFVGVLVVILLLVVGVSMARSAGTEDASSAPLSEGFGGYGGHGHSRHFGGGPFGGGFGAFGGGMRGGIGRFGGFGGGMRHSSGGFGGGARHSGGSGHFGGGGGGRFSGRGAGGKW